MNKAAREVAFLFWRAKMDNEQLSQEEAQDVWNQEAAKLEAGDDTPAELSEAVAPEGDNTDLPQDNQELEQTAQAAPQEKPDPLAEIRASVSAEIEALKQANAQLLHHVKTAEGRVAAMQREFQQARVAQQSVAPQNAPSQGQMAAAAKNPEKWEQLKQDFPEWAGAMEEYVAAKIGGIQPQQPGIRPEEVKDYVQQQLAAERAEMTKRIEEARVEGKYENWREMVNTPDFMQWFTAQPPEVRSLADSTRAGDAIRMLDLFNQTKGKAASEIKQERGARLAAAATTRPGQTPPPKTLDDMSPEELWNFEASKREKTRAQRGY
jgi:hypothetical protein